MAYDCLSIRGGFAFFQAENEAGLCIDSFHLQVYTSGKTVDYGQSESCPQFLFRSFLPAAEQAESQKSKSTTSSSRVHRIRKDSHP